MCNFKYWIWFSRIEKIGPKISMYLLEKYKSPENIYNLTKSELISVKKVTEDIADDILNVKYRQNLEKYEQYLIKNNIELITIYSEYYPEKLKDIYDPPVMLYIKGNKKILNNYGIAIVGCRDCSSYGKHISTKFGYELGYNNINVISGMARGIDTYSHIGALSANGKTIAVVGCGLDSVYPPENKELFDKIIELDGAVISEYIIGTKPEAKNFPRRNRIISGLSDAVIVVEAKEKSGTLITVDFALEQGKDVYAVPGNITSINSVGTNELIKQGAKPITDIKNVLTDICYI